MKQLGFTVLLIVCITACETTFPPKPKGYNRIDIKASTYIALPDSFPYQFQYPSTVTLKKDESWITEPYWIDLHYPQFNADIQITYKPINHDQAALEELLKDSYRLTSKHNIKAYAIDESIVALPNGMNATLMELSGEVPSQFQFHVTDSTTHFLRGALYFKTSLANDSLQPVIDHIKLDMVHMLKTLNWNNDK
ncbi:MAG: gliding motility lipoprotein GldD [Reichenbachiella sp.]